MSAIAGILKLVKALLLKAWAQTRVGVQWGSVKVNGGSERVSSVRHVQLKEARGPVCCGPCGLVNLWVCV